MKKVELLAPAGNYRAFIGALHAGADAVYLGTDQFSARAYADNFSKEELCRALHYAHLQGVKLYLTLNTLIKEKEFSMLYDHVAPFYEAGLDGVIIQDLGVWQYMRENFPDMELHASTQMTITGVSGAVLLKEMGASRIVPARELSLAELKEIREQSGLELECFIHGAMCYCYSGQCLFSSILGGRSGNRGRCAQPCRLPYQVKHTEKETASGECYPLSLKDMCTLEFLPALLEIGIDSFKIEGRMKRPEYAAGVTAIYRKYIDRYYADGAAHYQVETADLDKLRKLYIRSGIQTGYFERHNGREMITLHKPGYAGSDEALLVEIAEQYMQEEKRYPAAMKGIFQAGEPAMLQIACRGLTQTGYGASVQAATGRPMDGEMIAKQLRKTGNTHLQIPPEAIEIETGESVFIPVGQLNELRRNTAEALENKIIAANGMTVSRKLPEKVVLSPHKEPEKADRHSGERQGFKEAYSPEIHVTVRTLEQLAAVCQYPCGRIYLDSDFYLRQMNQICQFLTKFEKNAVFLALPYIVRKRDEKYLKNLFSLQNLAPEAINGGIKGFLVRNLESLYQVHSYCTQCDQTYEIVSDAGVYCFNSQAVLFLREFCTESYLPYELNAKECRQLTKNKVSGKLSMVVYTTVPMMVTANCLQKTTGHCAQDGREHGSFLKDRYQTEFPVLCNCTHCYNVIYNSVPYSLHGWQKEWSRYGLSAVRLDFILESGKRTQEILDYYYKQKNVFPVEKYTAGHYKRGVE